MDGEDVTVFEAIEKSFNGFIGIPWFIKALTVCSFFSWGAGAVLCTQITENCFGIVTYGKDLRSNLIAGGLSEGIGDCCVECFVDGTSDILLCVEDGLVGVV